MKPFNKLINSLIVTPLFLISLQSTTVQELNAAATSNANSKNNINRNRNEDIRIHPTSSEENEIWDYFVKTYSASNNNRLLQNEIQSLLIRNLQKCDINNYESIDEDELKLVISNNQEYVNSSNSNNLISSNNYCENSINTPELIDSLEELHTLFAQVLSSINLDNNCCYKVPSEEDQDKPLLSAMKEDLALSTQIKSSSSENRKKPEAGEVWGYGILLVTIISACSVVGVSVLPVMDKKAYKYILTAMIGLAVGSLTGSSIFHLMPQAFDLSAHDPCHSYLFTSLVVCGGIWMFFMVERFLKIIMDYKDRKDKAWQRVKVSSTMSNTPESSTISMLVDNHVHNNRLSNEERHSLPICSARDSELIYESQEQAIKASFGHQEKPKAKGHDHVVKFEQGKDSVIATVAWMIIFGDGLHNFIDGLSIGAALNESILTGVSISVAVLCEELPHELGDFAVLLNAGMSMRQAVTYNFLSACTCYLGMAIGIFLGEVEASSYIFALASGMFLYIALVDMVPEMNEVAEQSSKISVKKALWVLFLQNAGIFIGITALFILAKYQDNIKF